MNETKNMTVTMNIAAIESNYRPSDLASFRACARRYQKSGSDYKYVERKVRHNYLPLAAELILHYYYTA